MPATDREPDLAGRLAALESRLARLEERQSTLERTPILDLEALLERVLGPDAVGHMRAARREDLLTMSSIIETWIDRLERTSARGDKPRGSGDDGRRGRNLQRKRERIPLE